MALWRDRDHLLPVGPPGGLIPANFRSPAGALVWLVWLGLTAFGFITFAHTARNVPLTNDWRLVSPLTRHEPDLGEWLWAQEAAQPAPLSQLISLGAVVTARDFNAPGYLALLVLSCVAAALLLGMRQLRSGRTRYPDAIIPLLLLQPAFWGGRPASMMLQAVVPLGLATPLLLAIVADPVLRTRRWAALAAVALPLLPLSGLGGVSLALCVAGWVALVGWHHWPPREPDVSKHAGPALLAIVLVMLLVAGFYVGRYDAQPWILAHPTGSATIHTALSALAGAGGRAAVPHAGLVGAVLLCLLLSGGLLVLLAARRVREGERYRAGGLAGVMVGSALAVIVGDVTWSFAVLAVVAVLFTWELYGPPVGTIVVGLGSLIALLALEPANLRLARAARDVYVREMNQVRKDLKAGMTVGELAAAHRDFLLPWTTPARLAIGMEMLRRAQVGDLGRLRAAAAPSAPAGR